MSQRSCGAVVGLAAVAVALTATAVVRADSRERPAAERPERLTVVSAPARGTVSPGGAVTGTLVITNETPTAREVTDVAFAAASADTCAPTGLALAPTVPATPETPLEIPANGTTVLGWTAYLDGDADAACQGATFTSTVTIDGEPAGTVTVAAGRLQPPEAPTGGLTTSTRAAVRWSASTATDPAWVLERAVAGTDDWQPACGSSAARPLRALSCTDTGLTRSTAYTYRVTLRTGRWHATSRPSEPVTTQERPSA